jgi:hypothetical protein
MQDFPTCIMPNLYPGQNKQNWIGQWRLKQSTAPHNIIGCRVIDARTISGKAKNKLILLTICCGVKVYITYRENAMVLLARAFPSRAIYFVKRRRVRHDSNETGLLYTLKLTTCNNDTPCYILSYTHIQELIHSSTHSSLKFTRERQNPLRNM